MVVGLLSIGYIFLAEQLGTKNNEVKKRDRFSDMNTNIAAEAREKTPKPLHLFLSQRRDAYAEAALCAEKRGRAGLFQPADN